MRYLVEFSYDGTNYSGYQVQSELVTIQGEIERVLTNINGDRITPFISSGRTDKGVHANSQYGHVDINVSITPYKLKCAMNSNLPSDIHVINARIVDSNFHARYMVREKEYIYILNMGEYNPIERNYVFQYNKKLDINEMQNAIKHFVGVHSFKSFTPSKDKRSNYVREIYDASVISNDNKVIFKFRGNGFIKYQVRNMVGYLIQVGSGKRMSDDIPSVINSMDRNMASVTAHACGLYLNKVIY